jgi:hypothetical protein
MARRNSGLPAAHGSPGSPNASGDDRVVDPAPCHTARYPLPVRNAATEGPSGFPRRGEQAESAAELEFIRAMQDYQRDSGRLFPTWSEVLEVLHQLGYHKPNE